MGLVINQLIKMGGTSIVIKIILVVINLLLVYKWVWPVINSYYVLVERIQ